MAPLLSLSKRANASRHASISSLERDILTQKPSRGSGRVGVQRRDQNGCKLLHTSARERWFVLHKDLTLTIVVKPNNLSIYHAHG